MTMHRDQIGLGHRTTTVRTKYDVEMGTAEFATLGTNEEHLVAG